MALHAYFQPAAGTTPGGSVRRIADGLRYDFADSTFKATPGTPVSALTAETGIYTGLYSLVLGSTPAGVFTDGEYLICCHDMGNADALLDLAKSSMVGGDDAPQVLSGSGGSDPWATALPGAYGSGTAGAILGALAGGSGGSAPTAGEIAAAVKALMVEDGIDLTQALALILSTCLYREGVKTTGAATKDPTGTAYRIQHTTDVDGNTTAPPTLTLPS